MALIKATEDIYQDKPGQPGARTLLYKAGEYIREEDAEALGMVAKPAPSAQVKAQQAPPQDKAKRGPRERTTRSGPASRDKALTQPKED